MATNSKNTKNQEDVVVKEIYSRVRVAQTDEIVDDRDKGKHEKNEFVDPDKRFKDLQKSASYLSDKDKKTLQKAYEFAKEHHGDQRRKSGESFVVHPIEVAIILADLNMDIDTLCAALLHDTIEDTDASATEIQKLFNKDVLMLVEGVTKITQIEVGSVSESQAMTLRKMFVAMSNDLRVIVIKLADRLHNMRTLYALPEDRQIFKANETMEIFAPIAHRLGIDSIKWELEDLSFYYLEPNKYKQIARMVVESREERKAYLEEVIKILQKELKDNNITANIMGRPKHLYSIYSKMNNKGKAFSEIYDLIAVRIIVEDVKTCYAALGSVHSLWSPIPERFKDYIAMPKANMYQSLHTSVIGPAGRPLEVQIRTEDMHKTSEFGVAAHWRYKEKISASDAALDQQLAWLREMVDWQDETPDSKEMLKSLKVDLDKSEVFVFTPEGEAKSLRAGSTPVDFAYAVHTQVGNHCVGAKVNGAIVPLTYELKTGDRVEILTQKSAVPSRDWLNFVKTPSAKSKIRQYFSKKSRPDDLQAGKDILQAEMKKHGMGMSGTQVTRSIKELAGKLNFKNADELFIKIGNGKESVKNITNRLLKMMVDNSDKAETDVLKPKMQTGAEVTPKMITNVNTLTKKAARTDSGVVVKGINDVMVRLSRCCNPVPGDEIIGFVTRGRGVSIHRADCPNAIDLLKDKDRIIEVSWDNEKSKGHSYRVEIIVEARDRMGLLNDITNEISNLGANFTSFNAHARDDGSTRMNFMFVLSDITLASKLAESLKQINGVLAVYRAASSKDKQNSAETKLDFGKKGK